MHLKLGLTKALGEIIKAACEVPSFRAHLQKITSSFSGAEGKITHCPYLTHGFPKQWKQMNGACRVISQLRDLLPFMVGKEGLHIAYSKRHGLKIVRKM